MLFFTLILTAIRQPKVIFFPSPDPSYINILAELPIGSDIDATDEFMYQLEDDVFEDVITAARNKAGVESDAELTAEHWKEITAEFKSLYRSTLSFAGP